MATLHARDLAANCIRHEANLVVTFIVSPFVVHRPSDRRWGVSAPMMSLRGQVGAALYTVTTGSMKYGTLFLYSAA